MKEAVDEFLEQKISYDEMVYKIFIKKREYVAIGIILGMIVGIFVGGRL